MLHLNQIEISNIFHRHCINENLRLNHEGCKFNFSLEDKQGIDAEAILISIHQENTNKLVFTHIFANSHSML